MSAVYRKDIVDQLIYLPIRGIGATAYQRGFCNVGKT